MIERGRMVRMMKRQGGGNAVAGEEGREADVAAGVVCQTLRTVWDVDRWKGR